MTPHSEAAAVAAERKKESVMEAAEAAAVRRRRRQTSLAVQSPPKRLDGVGATKRTICLSSILLSSPLVLFLLFSSIGVKRAPFIISHHKFDSSSFWSASKRSGAPAHSHVFLCLR